MANTAHTRNTYKYNAAVHAGTHLMDLMKDELLGDGRPVCVSKGAKILSKKRKLYC